MSRIKFNEPNLTTFFYWMKERERIYRKKTEGKGKPWTDDDILRKYRFCNVFRENDTVTGWIRNNWRIPFKDHKNLWIGMAVARIINLPSTLEIIGFPEKLNTWVDHTEKSLRKLNDSGSPIYNGAYIITAGGRSGPKYRYTMEIIRELVSSEFEEINWPLECIWNFFREIQGFGPFIAYEVVSDLRWTRYYDGSDHLSWANAGPGAKRGVARLVYDDVSLSDQVDSKFALDVMRELLRIAPRRLPEWFPDLEMRDIEHSLCEVDKYLRVSKGEGRMKSKYQGE